MRSMLLIAAAPAQGAGAAEWRVAWGTALLGPEQPSASDATYRMIARRSIADSSVRVRLSNAFGSEPLTFDAACLDWPALADHHVRRA